MTADEFKSLVDAMGGVRAVCHRIETIAGIRNDFIEIPIRQMCEGEIRIGIFHVVLIKLLADRYGVAVDIPIVVDDANAKR